MVPLAVFCGALASGALASLLVYWLWFKLHTPARIQYVACEHAKSCKQCKAVKHPNGAP